MGFGSSSEAAQAPSRCLEPPVSQKLDIRFDPNIINSASREVQNPLSVFPLRAAASWLGLHSQPPAPSGVHNLLTPSSAPSLLALFHARSALGSALQSFLPLTQPYAVSSVDPLLTF